MFSWLATSIIADFWERISSIEKRHTLLEARVQGRFRLASGNLHAHGQDSACQMKRFSTSFRRVHLGVSKCHHGHQSKSHNKGILCHPRFIQKIYGDPGVAPIDIVETTIMRMIRFPTNEL